MRLLFVHDHRFHRDADGTIRTTGSLPSEVWDRYLEHFDEVRVVGRDAGVLSEGSTLAISSRPGVVFDLVPSATYRQLLLNRGALRARIAANVQACDAALLRLPSELGFLAAAECRSAGKPYSVEVVGCAWDALRNHGSLAGRIYAPWFYRRTRRALAAAPSALYVTSRWLQGRYPTAGKSFGASDVEIAPMSAAKRRARTERLERIAAGSSPQLGTVASLQIRSKGIQTAIAAIEQLGNSGLCLDYRVLGPGDPAPWVALAEKHGVADRVHFDGVRPAGKGVRAWLDGIDIHLQPSFQEGLPRATVEAMSRGAACIGSTCGGIPELIPPERLHAPGDVAALAERIRALVTDPQTLAEASRRDLKASAAFRPDKLAAMRSEFLAELRARALRQ